VAEFQSAIQAKKCVTDSYTECIGCETEISGTFSAKCVVRSMKTVCYLPNA